MNQDNRPEPPTSVTVYEFSTGHTLEVDHVTDPISTAPNPQESISLRSKDGTVSLSILMTTNGPQIRLSGADIHLESSGNISVACENFQLHARQNLSLESEGDAEFKANDIARVRGERVWLNTDSDPGEEKLAVQRFVKRLTDREK